MKVYLGIKYHPDNRNRKTIEIISQALEYCGFEMVCIRRDIEKWGDVHLSPHELMTKTFEVIRSCHLTVIDLTEKGVGLGIEAGYAYAQRVPVITIARKGFDISTTLRGISKDVYLYVSSDDLREIFLKLKASGDRAT